MMIDKFEKDEKLEKSFEIEADAVSVESQEEQEVIIVDEEQPVIAEEEPEKIQVNEGDKDSKVLIQPLADADLDKDLDLVPMEEQPPIEQAAPQKEALGQSGQIDEAEMARIAYFDRCNNTDYNQDLKTNMLELLNMGFVDFERNIQLLEKNHNNLEMTVSKMFE